MTLKHVNVPTLDHDVMMEKRFNHTVSPLGRLERRVVAHLIAHLQEAGFTPVSVDYGEEDISVSTMKEVMEVVFNLDECAIYFKNSDGCTHGVFIVLGNSGWDSISDWSYSDDDADGFNAAMNVFLDEVETLV